jgi:crossover junction endodeoxyribonuclease RuvC
MRALWICHESVRRNAFKVGAGRGRDCAGRERSNFSAVNLDPMRVFGIDCGTEVTGFGIVDSNEDSRSHQLQFRAMGAIRLRKTRPLPERLHQVFNELTAELERWRPDTVAIEEVFYSVNAKSALKLGQVRGVALLAAARQNIPVAEYAPLKIKSSVVGYGLAQKNQVQFMVARLLGLPELPEPADAADALAIAICHIHTAQTLALQGAVR